MNYSSRGSSFSPLVFFAPHQSRIWLLSFAGRFIGGSKKHISISKEKSSLKSEKHCLLFFSTKRHDLHFFRFSSRRTDDVIMKKFFLFLPMRSLLLWNVKSKVTDGGVQKFPWLNASWHLREFILPRHLRESFSPQVSRRLNASLTVLNCLFGTRNDLRFTLSQVA